MNPKSEAAARAEPRAGDVWRTETGYVVRVETDPKQGDESDPPFVNARVDDGTRGTLPVPFDGRTAGWTLLCRGGPASVLPFHRPPSPRPASVQDEHRTIWVIEHGGELGNEIAIVEGRVPGQRPKRADARRADVRTVIARFTLCTARDLEPGCSLGDEMRTTAHALADMLDRNARRERALRTEE